MRCSKTLVRRGIGTETLKTRVFIGKIDYIEDYNQIEIPKNPSLASLVYSPYFYKRTPFEYEQEVRVIIDVEPWAHSGKQQPGRGRGSRTSLLQMPTLDVRSLSDTLANAERIFQDLKHKRMLPFNESDHDPVRPELDLRLLNEVLDITSEDAHNAVHRLRELLCAEPSIHGGKKSKCDLEKEWAKLKKRDQ